MARIQVLALTPKTVGGFTTIPFALVIDDADREEITDAFVEGLKMKTGAVLVIVSEGCLTVANDVEVSDEVRVSIEQLVEAALSGESGIS